MEAVKQGSATVGLKSKVHAVLVALKVNIGVKFEMTSVYVLMEAQDIECFYNMSDIRSNCVA